jgi:arylsulfatase A-like enzyme
MTRPSHFSLLTSVYPRDHGALNNQIPLPEGIPLLPESFRKAGYQTAEITATARVLGKGSGLERGFDVILQAHSTQEPANVVVPKGLRWLRERDSDRPFFLWLHLFDPHMPYAPPPRYRPEPENPIARGLETVSHSDLADVASTRGDDLPREAYDRALDLYAGEVEHVDHWVGVLMDDLRDDGLLDQTVVVFTADHGECFENGTYFEHSNCLYEGAVRVPLIVRYPPSIPAGARRSDVVENLDVAPTLLRLCGLVPPTEFLGRDLFGPGDGDEIAFVQHPLPPPGVHERRAQKRKGSGSVMGHPVRRMTTDVEVLAARTEEWKYIQRGEVEELYHLPSDPEELDNLAEARPQPDALSELRTRLQSWKEAHPLRLENEERIHPELLEQLRTLGYVD